MQGGSSLYEAHRAWYAGGLAKDSTHATFVCGRRSRWSTPIRAPPRIAMVRGRSLATSDQREFRPSVVGFLQNPRAEHRPEASDTDRIHFSICKNVAHGTDYDDRDARPGLGFCLVSYQLTLLSRSNCLRQIGKAPEVNEPDRGAPCSDEPIIPGPLPCGPALEEENSFAANEPSFALPLIPRRCAVRST
jgi:hypothetical protein